MSYLCCSLGVSLLISIVVNSPNDLKSVIPSKEELRLPLSRESLLSQVKPNPISLLEDDFLSFLITLLLLFLKSPLNGFLDL